MLHNYLIEDKVLQSIKDVDGRLAVILVWVDDPIITASNNNLMHDTKEILGDRFLMKYMERLSCFLGVRSLDIQNDGCVEMSQKMYLIKLLVRFEMSYCKPRSATSEQRL